MSGRTAYIVKIQQRLEWLAQYSQAFVSSDGVGELNSIISGLLNRTYGYQLTLVNQAQGNIPAIDLIDSENSIAVQVTSMNSRRKVDDTVARFSAGTQGQRPCDSYKNLIIFIISTDYLRYMPPEGIDFTVQILNVPELLRYIQTLSPEKLKEILDFLTEEMGARESFSVLPPSPAPPLPHPAPPSASTVRLSSFAADRQQVLRFACLLPDGGLPWDLFRQCLSEAQQQALFELVDAHYLVRRDELLLISSGMRHDCLDQLHPASENCAEFLDRLLRYDRTRFWQRLRFFDRRVVHLHLAQTFARAAEILQDPDGSLALRCAAFYSETKETANALQWCLRAVRNCENAPVRDPWCLGNAYLRTAECYQQLGDNANSLKFCKKVLSLMTKDFLLADSDTARIYFQTGLAQVGLDDHPAALKSLNKAQNYSENSMTEDHPLRSSINNMLSIANKATGNIIEAREYKLQSLRTEAHTRSSTNSAELVHKLAQLEIVQAMPALLRGTKDEVLHYEIGNLFLAQRDYTKALEYHMQALKLREQRSGTAPKKLADSYHIIGSIFSDLDDHTEAMEYLQKAKEIREKSSGIPAADLIRSYLDLGAVFSDRGMHQYALDYLTTALTLQKKYLSSQAPELAETYTALGNICRTLGRDKAALENYSNAVNIRETSLPANHPELASSYMNLANAHIQLAQHSLALRKARRALAIYEATFPKGHPQRISAQQTVSWLEEFSA